MKSSLNNRKAVRWKLRVSNERGSMLLALMIFITGISILSMAAVRVLSNEKQDISTDYYNLVAASAAESCINIAQSEMFTGSARQSMGQGMERTFHYGKGFFQEVGGKNLACTVQTRSGSGGIHMESVAQLTEKMATNETRPPQMFSVKKVKLFFKKKGARASTLWWVRD